jgi:hypothetical protein
MMTVQEVFATDSRCGWQINALAIAESCPIEFFADGNAWAASAARLYGTFSSDSWKWKVIDPSIQERLILSILCLLSSIWIDKEKKLAIAGWMLSDMLHEAP